MAEAVIRARADGEFVASLILPVVGAYFAASLLGLLFVKHPNGVAALWPAAGLGLALFLQSPRPRWASCGLGIVIGNVAANLLAGASLSASAGFAVVNLIEREARLARLHPEDRPQIEAELRNPWDDGIETCVREFRIFPNGASAGSMTGCRRSAMPQAVRWPTAASFST